MKRIFLALVFTIISGCASVPVSTMLKFSGFDQQYFTSLDARQIRARVSVNLPYTIDLDKTKLSCTLATDTGELHYQFPLTLLTEETLPAEEGFFSSSVSKQRYTFELSEEALNNFENIQRSFEQQQGENGFSVGTGFNGLEEADDNIVILTIELQLEEADGFFTLIDEAELELTESD